MSNQEKKEKIYWTDGEYQSEGVGEESGIQWNLFFRMGRMEEIIFGIVL